MKRPSILPLLLGALLLLGASSCGNVDKMVERGDYEQTIRLAQRKLTGKQKKNPKYVRALEEAFNRANARDMDRADRILRGTRPDWVALHDIYHNIDRRQRALRPLVPVFDKNGMAADLRFIRVGGLVSEARANASAQLYREATDLVALGRNGDKEAARAAFYKLEDLEEYGHDYQQSHELAREAEALGQVRIALELDNRSGGYLPAGFERELLRLSTVGMDDRWRKFDLGRRAGQGYDYAARIVITDIAVSPDRLQERTYTDAKRITDGREYVLDASGNVAKDTLGNDITRPRKIDIQAEILEVYQSKTARVRGSYELIDLRNRRTVDRQQLTAEAIFEHYASTYRGDRRALTRDSRCRIGNRPQPFPTAEALILDAADRLKPQLQKRLRRTSSYI